MVGGVAHFNAWPRLQRQNWRDRANYLADGDKWCRHRAWKFGQRYQTLFFCAEWRIGEMKCQSGEVAEWRCGEVGEVDECGEVGKVWAGT